MFNYFKKFKEKKKFKDKQTLFYNKIQNCKNINRVCLNPGA